MSVPMAGVSESSPELESFPQGPINLGSNAHKVLFCRTLLDTFDPYKPAVIDWPKLETETRDRLVSLPIWDIAVQTEGRARLNVASYAAVTPDPLLRKAIELNALRRVATNSYFPISSPLMGLPLRPNRSTLCREIRNGPSWSPATVNALTASCLWPIRVR